MSEISHLENRLARSGPPVRNLISVGFGKGDWLRSLLQSPPQTLSDVFVIDSTLKRCPEEFAQIQPGSFQIHWLLGLTLEEVGVALIRILENRSRARRMRARRFLLNPSFKDRLYFEGVCREWDATCHFVEHCSGYKVGSLVGLQNIVENFSFIEQNPGVQSLEKKFESIPAILVSAGPSLRKSLAFLKTLQNKALILAVDASLKTLLDAEIVPHFVFSMERDITTKTFYSHLPSWLSPKRMPNFVAYPLVPAETVATYGGPKWVAYRNYEIFGFLEKVAPRGFLATGHSVAHMAFRAAAYFGCSEVVLVGQDLGFDPENYASHATFSDDKNRGKDRSFDEMVRAIELDHEKLVWWPGNISARVPTTNMYLVFLQEFYEHFSAASISVTNATEGGIRMSGIPWKKISDATARWQLQPDLFEKIRGIRSSSKFDGKIDVSELKTYLNLVTSEMKACDDIIAACLLSKEASTEGFKKVIQKLREHLEALIASSGFSALTVEFMGARFYQIENDWNSCQADEAADFFRRAQILKNEFKEFQDISYEVLEGLRGENLRERYRYL